MGITKYPFFPSGTKSLLSKVLTRDVWDACKDRKDKYGYTFQQCIFSGAKWTNSGIGVYAGCHEGFYTFSPLFDKIISDYHPHSPTDKHISNMDHNQLQCPDFPADEDKMINSTRRVVTSTSSLAVLSATGLKAVASSTTPP